MHCFLQKLQDELGDHSCLRIYRTISRGYGGDVTFYPRRVKKEIPKLDNKRFKIIDSMYGSITKSRYLIQLESIRNNRGKTILVLHPFGDPQSEPVDWKDLENATHDMLHGLADKAGFTHRDLRWDNCVKVDVAGESKWVIIDLEAVGRDKEEWDCEPLRGWDERTLEEGEVRRKREGKVYTNGWDMYQLGKLISEWLDAYGGGGNEERQVMGSHVEKMRKRRAAAKILEDICKESCKRCHKFGTQL